MFDRDGQRSLFSSPLLFFSFARIVEDLWQKGKHFEFKELFVDERKGP